MQKLPDNFETYDEARQRGFLALKELKDKGKTWYTFYGYKEDGKTWDVRTQPNPDGNGGWTDKYEYLPYPTTQLSVNPNLKQNPGW